VIFTFGELVRSVSNVVVHTKESGLIGSVHDQVSLALQLLAVQRCDTSAVICFVRMYCFSGWYLLRSKQDVSDNTIVWYVYNCLILLQLSDTYTLSDTIVWYVYNCLIRIHTIVWYVYNCLIWYNCLIDNFLEHFVSNNKTQMHQCWRVRGGVRVGVYSFTQHIYTHAYLDLHIGYLCVSGGGGGTVTLLKSGRQMNHLQYIHSSCHIYESVMSYT